MAYIAEKSPLRISTAPSVDEAARLWHLAFTRVEVPPDSVTKEMQRNEAYRASVRERYDALYGQGKFFENYKRVVTDELPAKIRQYDISNASLTLAMCAPDGPITNQYLGSLFIKSDQIKIYEQNKQQVIRRAVGDSEFLNALADDYRKNTGREFFSDFGADMRNAREAIVEEMPQMLARTVLPRRGVKAS